MDAYDQIVSNLFGVKDMNYISKRGLVVAIAKLNADYEAMYVDLFKENPNHKRFEKFTDAEREAMIERCKK
jgi:hypothetical protein